MVQFGSENLLLETCHTIRKQSVLGKDWNSLDFSGSLVLEIVSFAHNSFTLPLDWLQDPVAGACCNMDENVLYTVSLLPLF